MSKVLKVDIAIIGAGAGGLSVAAAASQMGAKVVLIESGKMGGECLNNGCVPSKSLLSAAKMAQNFRVAELFGIHSIEPEIDFAKIMQKIKNIIATLSVNDSVERFTNLGVQVFKSSARFINADTIETQDTLIKARRFVIATGSSPAIPMISGIEQVMYYTNETIFNLTKKPEHLIIIGGGPVGCELAQAFLLLGSKVTIIEAFHVLPHDEQDLVELLRAELIKQGLNLYENAQIEQVSQKQNQIEISFKINNQLQIISGSNLLIAAGRKPNIDHLNLEKANIQTTNKGVLVDQQLRTTNKRVYALGDVIGPYQFTHMANYQAGIIIRNILFRMRSKVDYRVVPWVTYTDPELAHVGLLSTQILQSEANIRILVSDFSTNDRAQTEHKTLGRIKVIINSYGKILGVSILGAHAGELLLPWIMAVKENKSLRALAELIVPYPTLSEISKKVASEYYAPKLFSKYIRLLVKLLRLFK